MLKLDDLTFQQLTINQVKNIRSRFVTNFLENGQLTYQQALNLHSHKRQLLEHPQCRLWLRYSSLQMQDILLLASTQIHLGNLDDAFIHQAVTNQWLRPLQAIQLEPYYRHALRKELIQELFRQGVMLPRTFFRRTSNDLKKLEKVNLPTAAAAEKISQFGISNFLALSTAAVKAFNVRAPAITATNVETIRDELNRIQTEADLQIYLLRIGALQPAPIQAMVPQPPAPT